MAKSYEERKDQVNEIQREQRRKGRDIGPLPSVVNPERKASCRLDLKAFCLTYFKPIFYMGFSPDHLAVIATIERAVTQGGTFAVAMPRGFGKTTISRIAAMWAVCYGHKSFVVLIGASGDHAKALLTTIKTDLEVNELLAEDFPETCHPIRCLEGRASNAGGQLLDGARTRIVWREDELVLPTVPNGVASGSVLRVAGITGSVRGMLASRASDGATIRPDFVLIDDPQTDESARSVPQTRARLNTVSGAILGLAGPGKKISGVMPITVIAKDDLADRVLDRQKYPQWQGYKTQMLRSFPANAKLWEQYAEVRANSLRAGKGILEASWFYHCRRKEMDEGAEASWQERFNDDEISAIQNAMNLKLDDEGAFQAEYQNAPISASGLTPLTLKPDDVLAKVAKGMKRGVVPDYATHLTAFIDVHSDILYYLVLATNAENFTSHVVDYGAFPEQGIVYFRKSDAKRTLQTDPIGKGKSQEAAIFAGIELMVGRLASNRYQRLDGKEMQVSRLFVDSGWQTGTVYQVTKESQYRNVAAFTKGRGVLAKQRPMGEYNSKPGERKGWNWRREVSGLIQFDTNAWKTFVADAIKLSPGDAGNLSIFDGSEMQHRMFVEHATSELPELMTAEGNGRTIYEWSAKPGHDNHLLDCLVGAYVAASEQGAVATGHKAAKPQAKRRRAPAKVNWG